MADTAKIARPAINSIDHRSILCRSKVEPYQTQHIVEPGAAFAAETDAEIEIRLVHERMFRQVAPEPEVHADPGEGEKRKTARPQDQQPVGGALQKHRDHDDRNESGPG